MTLLLLKCSQTSSTRFCGQSLQQSLGNHCRLLSSSSILACKNDTSNDKNTKKNVDENKETKKKYTDTLLLPKTEFPMKIPYNKREEHEIAISNKCQFDEMYGFQRLWRQGQPEFVLHDGPPYANGEVHMGHAVNKILKDITNRYKLLKGYKINYIPGWDCHGLPIELKSVKDGRHGVLSDPIKIRNSARQIVDTSIASHIECFKRWGILAEWDTPYKTLDKSYMKFQLQSFYDLYQKEQVFRDMKPVFWSPSSKTALAEAELEYHTNHESPSVFLALDLTSDTKEFLSVIGHENITLKNDSKVKAVIWTTTPWTLPANQAIAFRKSEKYTLLKTTHGMDTSYYIVASPMVVEFMVDVKKKLDVVLEFEGHVFDKLQYKHPWFESVSCPFIHGDHVNMEKGTGLVHIAPAHGHDDFVLGLKHKLPLESFIDSDGRFDSNIPELKGMDVLTSGNNKIIKTLEKNVIHSSKITHSYPYDWRTKEPVIIKTSLQWFINTDVLKTKALDLLKNVNIYPEKVENGMMSQLVRRPYWCISRQRTWGVPIPVLYHKDTGEPLIDKKIVDRLCEIIDKTGNVDSWWDAPVSALFDNEEESNKYVKGKDIFDIWFDSGISWHILGKTDADVYLEGKDQFQGWFQSSLLLSTALRGTAPYKNLYVHGFVVDEMGKKMSKSIGNVVNPVDVVSGGKKQTAYGSDVLRWWVASQAATDGSNVNVSQSLLRSSDESVQKLRNVIKFLISFCNEAATTELYLEGITYDELMYTDQFMLSLLRDFRQQISSLYDQYHYHRVLMKTLHFATTQVSSQYFTWIKDRLYCDYKQSQSRKSCIYVMCQIYLTLAKVLAPVLPYLIEESYLHYKLGNQSIFKSTWFEDDPWGNSQINSTFELALDVRDTLNHVIGANNPKGIWVELHCNADTYKLLQILHPVVDDEIVDKCDSELCDILQVSGVDVKCFDSNDPPVSLKDDPLRKIDFSFEPVGVGHSNSGFSLGISETEMTQCLRCRRYCSLPGDVLCARCISVTKNMFPKSTTEESVSSQTEPEITKKTVVN